MGTTDGHPPTPDAPKPTRPRGRPTRADFGQPIEAFLARQPPVQRAILEELRRLVACSNDLGRSRPLGHVQITSFDDLRDVRGRLISDDLPSPAVELRRRFQAVILHREGWTDARGGLAAASPAGYPARISATWATATTRAPGFLASRWATARVAAWAGIVLASLSAWDRVEAALLDTSAQRELGEEVAGVLVRHREAG